MKYARSIVILSLLAPGFSAAEAPRSVATKHTGHFGGAELAYTAKVGETILHNNKGQPAGSLFSITYTKDDVKDSSSRPVTFLFNGGPGSSSIWLHLAAFGPRRAVIPAESRAPGAAPYAIAGNPHSPLDVTDLVFIDPIGTGFSRILPGGKPEDFYGVAEDGRSVGEFIRQWITVHKRWNSPKYIGGESYGSMRAAELANRLQNGDGMFLNGILLFGQALDFTQTTPLPGFDMAYPLYLPSMAATAWYHGKADKRGRTFERFIDEARQFAQGEYPAALFAGSRLPAEQRKSIAQRLAVFTGLAPSLILEEDLRVTAQRFCVELLRSERKIASRYDSRYTAAGAHGPNEEASGDPVTVNVSAAYTAVMNGYLRSELGVEFEETYESRSAAVGANWNWNYGPGGMRAGIYRNFAPLLGAAMRQNPDLRLFVAAGYYDMLTPFFSAEHTVAHNGMPLERVEIAYYHSGHMPYLDEPNLKKLAADVRSFLRKR